MAGATGLEPAASCVTGRRSNLGEAALVNVIKNWRTKGVFYAQTEDVRFDCLSDVGDRAAMRCNWLILNGVGGRRLVQMDTGGLLVSSP